MKEGLGISYLWQLSDTHPFHFAGVKHDRAYDLKIGPSSKPYDDEFLKDCLSVANTVYLKAQAYLFYLLVRSWGALKW